MTMSRGDPVTCPACGTTKLEEDWPVDIRSGEADHLIFGKVLVNSFGFRCDHCGAVWGHQG